ncbi:anti-sigma factor family protein [Actinophytocola glycyrrhizae]|uniref:Anti-sigma factor family protein n=1 Tax=Actinophytocola glycyrrhizae TaxID=2044873 RepID=A0ABV9S7K4_9PSEU
MTCQHTMTLGVYLLGALDPAERFAFEAHLSSCDVCRRELVRLSPLPGLLNQVTPEDFADDLPSTEVAAGAVATRAQPVTEPVPLPPVQEPRDAPVHVLPEPQGKRRYWRVAAAAAAVVVLAVAGVFGWGAVREEEAPPAAAGVTWSYEAGATSVQARLIDHDWGTEIQSEIHGAPPGRGCYLKVYDHYGKWEIAGWWGTDHDPNVEIPSSTSIQRGKIAKLEYLLDDRETVVATIQAPGR